MTAQQYRYFSGEPNPFTISLRGTLNGEDVAVEGAGAVARLGLYEATLNFTTIPAGFHPSAIATFTVSICCNFQTAMNHDALNIQAMGATGYETKRVLTFGDLGEVTIEGDVDVSSGGTRFEGEITGSAELPEDLASSSIYTKRIEPHDEGATLLCCGNGALFRQSAPPVPVVVESQHRLRPGPPPNPLRANQYRISTETGTLLGRTYRTTVHAVVDDQDPIEAARTLSFRSLA